MGETTAAELLKEGAIFLDSLRAFISSREVSIAITKMEEVLHRLEDAVKKGL